MIRDTFRPTDDFEGLTIAVLLLDPSKLADVGHINADDFLDPQHCEAFKIIREGFEGGTHGFAKRLIDTKTVEDIDAAIAYTHQLYQLSALACHTQYYAGKVLEASLKRKNEEAVALLRTGKKSEALRMLDDIDRRRLPECDNDYADLIESLEGRDDSDSVLSGLLPLDNAIRFQPGQLITIAARTSMGKTALLTSIAANCWQESRSVAFVSIEMPKLEVNRRLLSMTTGIPYGKLHSGELTRAERKAAVESTNHMEASQIRVYDAPGQTIDLIRTACHQHRKKFGRLDLIAVDYLQLVQPSDRRVNRTEQIGSVTRGLKQIAREFECPLLTGSQLSREADKGNRRPQLSDLRESGSIEQDSDVVVFIHGRHTEPGGARSAELIVAKNRNGPKQICEVDFIADRMQFVTPNIAPPIAGSSSDFHNDFSPSGY